MIKINKSFSIVFCLYYSNKDLREEVYLLGIYRILKQTQIFDFIKNICISIFRLKKVIKFKKYNSEIYSILYGVSSRTQKKIINGNHNGVEYFAKSPLCNTAVKALLNESKAIKEFNFIGIKTMKKINIIGDFCYENVVGNNYYTPNLVYKKCLKIYPVTKKIKVSEYFKKKYNYLDFNSDNIIDLTISHGDLTVWNTKINKDEVVYIDLERYQKFRVKYFDIFYYIISYLFFTLKLNTIEILKRIEYFIKENNIEKLYFDVFLVDLLKEKQKEVKDGYIYIERVNFINTIEKLIILSK